MLGATKVEDLQQGRHRSDEDKDAPVQRRVVCAANKQSDGTILLGARHWDSCMHATAKLLEYPWPKDSEIQGFIDQFGVFMDRCEAWNVALAAGQIRYIESWNYRPSEGGYVLYSENLY